MKPPAAAGKPCSLKARPKGDMIMWMKYPGGTTDATAIGSGPDAALCKYPEDTLPQVTPHGAGYCWAIAWANDNPKYDVDKKPAPKPTKILAEYGEGC